MGLEKPHILGLRTYETQIMQCSSVSFFMVSHPVSSYKVWILPCTDLEQFLQQVNRFLESYGWIYNSNTCILVCMYSHNIFIYKHYTVKPWFWCCANHLFNTLAMFQITDIGRRAVTICELSWVYLLMPHTDGVSPLHSLQFLSDACTYMCYIQIIQVSVWFIYMYTVFCMCADYIIYMEYMPAKF